MVAPIYVELDSCYIPGIDWIGSNVVLNIVKTNINGLPILVNTFHYPLSQSILNDWQFCILVLRSNVHVSVCIHVHVYNYLYELAVLEK